MVTDKGVVGIDPGTFRSAWVMVPWGSTTPEGHGLVANEEMVRAIRAGDFHGWDIAVEWTAPRGMPASAELFESLWWAGRFAEAAGDGNSVRVLRSKVKLHLCGSTRAKDANVTAALVDRYGGIGGRREAVGTKRSPGPLYGVTRDRWAALGVALTYRDMGEAAVYEGDPG